jgi:N-methylhydantoinase A/oxoprolinase/acetone carboxylase beta subunit
MPEPIDLRIGIDVGGTNTDAVVVDNNQRLLAQFKTQTRADLGTGINQAIIGVSSVLDAPLERVTHVMLGTTHATNALLEGRELYKTAVIRIGAPATLSIPPLLDWPEELRTAASAGEIVIPGGSEVSGDPIVPFEKEELVRFLEKHAGTVQAVAITSVFSPVSAEHELEAEQVVREILGEVPVTLSHRVGALGLLERENACVLNASLVGVASKVVTGLTEALERNGIDANCYLTQNDGTLMSLDYVLRFPVLTIGSGPANSMRGAGYLTQQTDAVVIDVGGTSTDIGVLVNGFPRESAAAVTIGGVRTNFRMPDLNSIAIGGGTTVEQNGEDVKVGPESVGYRLVSESLVFGGSCPTLSDAAVDSGRAEMGKRDLLTDTPVELARALRIADQRIETALDQMKTTRGEATVVAVGGGSVVLPPELHGASEVLHPEHYDVANAIGAAIASVSGQVDKVFKLSERTREEATEEAMTAARNEAISAGADAGAVEIVELEEVPMAYLTEPVVRIRAKAAGPLGAV